MAKLRGDKAPTDELFGWEDDATMLGPVYALNAGAPLPLFASTANDAALLSAPAGTLSPDYLGDGIADDTSTTATLAIGQTITSTIDSNGDKDYFRITLQAGQSYVFTMNRAGNPDPYLELHDASNNLLVQNDDGGIINDAQFMYRAPTSGTYYVVARGLNSTDTGGYRLSAIAVETGNTSPMPLNGNSKPSYSWTEAAYQLTRTGASWASDFGQAATVTYAFRSTAPATMPSGVTGFARFSAAQIASAEAALQAWADVANIHLVRVGSGTSGESAYSDNATILFSDYTSGQSGAAAFAYQPGFAQAQASSLEGDVWVNSTLTDNTTLTLGAYGPHVLLHEVGHALGLSHGSDYNAAEGVTLTYDQNATWNGDTRLLTVMSYFPSSSIAGGQLSLFESTPELFDIAAIQRLYGANMTTRTGDTVYGFNSNAGRPEFSLTSAAQVAGFTIWDAGGNDALDLSGYTLGSTIDLREEALSTAGPGQLNGRSYLNIAIARGVVIENALGGSGDDSITGNPADNTINAGAGADTVSGREGNDWLYGGAGRDLLDGGDGHDHLYGGDDNDRLNGGSGYDVIDGGAGDDTVEFSYSQQSAAIIRYDDTIGVFRTGSTDRELLTSVAMLRFSNGVVYSPDISQFNAIDYLASYGDLITAIGDDPQRAFVHYVQSGYLEGRAADRFDGAQYVASFGDLIASLGYNEAAGAKHYVDYGYAEHRALDTFDEFRYEAGFGDLITAFGLNGAMATKHWIEYGYAEHRVSTFDPLQYEASYGDLIQAFGTDTAAATKHYIQYGYNEHRSADAFDAAQYLANYADLRAAFGSNVDLATTHFIQYGYIEGRTDHALPAHASADPGVGFATAAAEADPNAMTADASANAALSPASEWSVLGA